MRDHWNIYQNGGFVESATSESGAQRAALILRAHEWQHGRDPQITVEPNVDLDVDFERLNLPRWAVESLRNGKASKL